MGVVQSKLAEVRAPMGLRLPVAKRHVHKALDQNRFLSWLCCDVASTGGPLYMAKVRLVPDHTYFFEHDRAHLPGLYIIEAGRQLGLAVPHLFLNVGYEYSFILEACEMEFSGFANLSDDLFIESRVLNPVYRKGRLQSLSFEGAFIQNGEPIVRYQSHIRLIHERLLKRFEKQNS